MTKSDVDIAAWRPNEHIRHACELIAQVENGNWYARNQDDEVPGVVPKLELAKLHLLVARAKMFRVPQSPGWG
jgi:hypothetical protein